MSPCVTGKIGGATFIACTRGGKRKRCKWFGESAPYLCDGANPNRKSGTCDAPICGQHRTHIGPEIDYCPDCAAVAAP